MSAIPVYIINGFLDSGKSEFIKYTIAAPYFQVDGTTLIILCEEGEIEFEEDILNLTRSKVTVIEGPEDFTLSKLKELEKQYSPERIIIEWNGMWNFKEFSVPEEWVLEQQITNIDGSTFPMYYTNMKSLLAEMLRSSDMIIFNRCDGLDEELATYKRNVKAINQNAEIIFEDSEGEINAIFEDDLPYDLSSDTIELDDNSYGIWYIDTLDHADRYKGKTLIFKAMVLKPEDFPKDCFIPVRMVMTCCAEDMTFLGFACQYKDTPSLEEKSWVLVKGHLEFGYHKAYGSEGPVLYADSVEPTDAPEEEVITFM